MSSRLESPVLLSMDRHRGRHPRPMLDRAKMATSPLNMLLKSCCHYELFVFVNLDESSGRGKVCGAAFKIRVDVS